MLIKTIIIFLGAMALVAMIGRALFPSVGSSLLARRRKPALCKACGRIGSGICDCGRKA